MAEILLGILVGPDVLGLAEPDALIERVEFGAFTAGLIVGPIARGERPQPFQVKLDGVGYGFLIPIFFIATGLDFDLDALLSSASSLILVPGFAALFLLSVDCPRSCSIATTYRRRNAARWPSCAHLRCRWWSRSPRSPSRRVASRSRTPSRSSAPACCRCWSSR